MCSSSQNKDSTTSRGVNKSSVTDDVKRTASRENGQMKAGNPKKDANGEGLKFREIKVCDKDVSVSQETFPSFSARDQLTFIRTFSPRHRHKRISKISQEGNKIHKANAEDWCSGTSGSIDLSEIR